MFVAVNEPLRKRCTSGGVETDDLAGRYSKELFAIARPGEGVIVLVGDFDWAGDDKVSVPAVVDPKEIFGRSGDELASVG